MKKIKYLNLELSVYQNKKITLDRYNIDSNVEGNHRHELHIDNS